MQTPAHRGPFRTTAIAILGAALLATALGGTTSGIGPSGGASAATVLPAPCREQPHAAAIANALLADRYRLGGFPVATLPADPTWAEDPFHDVNWRVRLHSLSWLDTMTGAWRSTGSEQYRRRVRFLVDDWLKDNPRAHPATRWAWYDQSTGLRTSAFVCAGRVLGWWPRLRRGVAEHGRTLADPTFYTGAGNHALDQSIGLLDAGVALARADWVELAQARIATLLIHSVSAAGITNEQAVGYAAYNQQRYLAAAARLEAYGMSPPPAFGRVIRMSRMLAHATLPDGRYVMIGDTEALPVRAIAGSEAAYAATAGRSGTRPATTLLMAPRAGWLFARTGWGTERPFSDEVVMTLRFGGRPAFHGHADAGSVTLYGAGSELVLDPGKYRYTPSALRSWFVSRDAHNTVMADGVRFRPAMHLVADRSTDQAVDVVVAGGGRPSVTQVRRVVFARRTGWMVIEDRITSAASHRFLQRWHLAEDARPLVLADGLATRGPGGRLRLFDLGGDGRPAGRSVRLDFGWVSYRYGDAIEAPVGEVIRGGREVRFVTLLVPHAPDAPPRVSDVVLAEDGFSFTIELDGAREHVEVDRRGTRIIDA